MSRGIPFTLTASKRAVARKGLKVAQVVGDPPDTLVVEPNGPRTHDDFLLIVAVPNGGLLRGLLVSIPKLDTVGPRFHFEVRGAQVARFQCALHRCLDGVGRQGFAEVLLGLSSDLRYDLGFEFRNEGDELSSRPEAEVQRVGIKIVGVWLPGHACLYIGFPFQVLSILLEGCSAATVRGGFGFADGDRHGFSLGTFGWGVFERGVG